MAQMSWFRFYSEAAHDRKIIMAARAAGISKLEMVGAWTTLLCLANDSPLRGRLYVTFQERFTATDIETELETDSKTTQEILSALMRYEMLDQDENGAYRVKNWQKRQFESDKSTNRVQKHREKQQDGVSETFQKRSGNAPEADTESETEADTEAEPPRLLDIDFGTLCERYSKDIGVITATTSDMLKDDLEKYGLNNCLDAIGECVANNVRRWSYARAILERWKTDGRGNKSKKTAPAPAPAIYTPEPEPPGGWLKPDPERSRKLLAQVEEIARQKREALNGTTS